MVNHLNFLCYVYICPVAFDHLSHFQWQLNLSVGISPQMVTSNPNSQMGVTQHRSRPPFITITISTWMRLRTWFLQALQAAKWNTRGLLQRSSFMTTLSSAPCFFTMGPKRISFKGCWSLLYFFAKHDVSLNMYSSALSLPVSGSVSHVVKGRPNLLFVL